QRHQSEIAGHLLPALKAVGFSDDQHEGQCGERTNTGMGHQSTRFGTLLHFLLDRLAQFRDSVDPATPEDRVVAGWPTEPAGMIPAARVRVPATTSSYSAGLRSGPPLATGSLCACGPAPCGAGATAVAADPGSPNSAPKSAGHVLPAVTSGSVARPADLSSACGRAWSGSRRRLRSTIQSVTRPLAVRTNEHARWPPFPF